MNDLLIEIRSAYPSSSRFSNTERDLIPSTSITGIFTAFFIALEYSPKYASSARVNRSFYGYFTCLTDPSANLD